LRHRELETFDGREDRERRRDHGVAEEESGTDQPEKHKHGRMASGMFH